MNVKAFSAAPPACCRSHRRAESGWILCFVKTVVVDEETVVGSSTAR